MGWVAGQWLSGQGDDGDNWEAKWHVQLLYVGK